MKKTFLFSLIFTLTIGYSLQLLAWPGSSVDTSDVDAVTDDPSQARIDIHDAFNKLNDIIDDRDAANGIPSLDSGSKVPTNQLPQSSTTGIGAVELSTDSEAITGTDTSRAITPSNHAAIHGRGALVTRNSFTVSNNTDTDVDWIGEEYDTDSIHDTVTNSSRLTVPSGVTKVQLFAQIRFDANSTGRRKALFRKNSGTYNASSIDYETSPDATFTSVLQLASPHLVVSGTDYFEVRVFQDSGGDLNVVSSWFSMHIIE